jgi:ribosomal peptide maturation radical SAM protein 1
VERLPRVLLVVMPFAASDRPAVGVSTLKAGLSAMGVQCQIAYLNLAFAELLGRDDYERLANHISSPALAGEWAFAEALYGRGGEPTDAYVDAILRGTYRIGGEDIELILRARSLVPTFLQRSLSATPWPDYGIVGFSSFVAQNLAALALAKLVKEAHPGVTVVFGGANWRGRPGLELHRRFPFVDLAVSGEGDRSLPELVRLLSGDDRLGAARIGGLIYRRGGTSVANPEQVPLENLDDLPTPDYSDFQDARRCHPGIRSRLPVLMMEGSRGCWWATSHPCTFCAGGSRERTYRSKSARRVIEELHELTERWACSVVQLTDELVPPEFLDSVLPVLAADPLAVRLFFEVRPTVTREQLVAIAAVRGEIQTGIESLSDHVLRLMRKGSRALENVRMLKWCRALDINPSWNFLYATPGETVTDCEEMLRILPAIRFLTPPVSLQPVYAYRDNEYHERPQSHGLGKPRVPAVYRHIYPFPDRVLLGIAGWVEFEDMRKDVNAGPYDRLEQEVEDWRREYWMGELRVARRDGSRLVLKDTRPGAAASMVKLDALESWLYDACEDIAESGDLPNNAVTAATGHYRGADELNECLASLVQRRLMISAGTRYLSLALPERQSRRATLDH